jgi:hypothetical protein
MRAFLAGASDLIAARWLRLMSTNDHGMAATTRTLADPLSGDAA